MNLELWDVNGAYKIPINLLKSMQGWTTQNVEKSFKFVGARTRSLFLFEMKDKKMAIKPEDWLLFQEGQWMKLNSPKEIDDYVEMKRPGIMIVFDGVVKKEGQQVLQGTIFNATRSESKTIGLPIHSGATTFSILESEGDDKKKEAVNRIPIVVPDEDDEEDE